MCSISLTVVATCVTLQSPLPIQEHDTKRTASSGAITEIIDADGGGSGQPLDTPTDVAVDVVGNVFVTGRGSTTCFGFPPTAR